MRRPASTGMAFTGTFMRRAVPTGVLYDGSGVTTGRSAEPDWCDAFRCTRYRARGLCQSSLNACITSIRDARAAGTSDATSAAATSTLAAATTGMASGMRMAVM